MSESRKKKKKLAWPEGPRGPYKSEDQKKVRKNVSLRGETVAILQMHEKVGFKSESDMLDAGVMIIMQKVAKKTLADVLLPDPSSGE